MSEFKSYAHRFDEFARETFTEMTTVTEALRAADKQRKDHPMRPGLTPQAAAKAAKLEAAYQTALGEYEAMRKNLPAESRKKVEALRNELAENIVKRFTANAADLDHDVLTLLNSGILNDTDFAKLMHDAKTPTMRRLIAKYAEDRARKVESSGDSITARNLRDIARNGNEEGRRYLAAFDSMADAFNRTVKNPAMIPHWEHLTAPLIDMF